MRATPFFARLRHRFSLLKPTMKIVVVGGGVLAVWLLSGLVFSSSKQNGVTESANSLDLVNLLEIQEFVSSPKQRHAILYGETEAGRSVELKAETQGVVKEILEKEGASLKKGDIIIKIDVRDRYERLAQAKALVNQRQIEYKAAVKLQGKGFQTEVRLAEAKTRLEEAKATLAATQLDFNRTRIKAPFDGVLEDVAAEIGDFVGVGVFGGEGAIATVVDLDPIKVTGRVSQQDMPYLDRDAVVEVKLANDQRLKGWIRFVSKVAEQASRTFRIEVEIANEDHAIPAGVAAELRIPLQKVSAIQVSSAVLSLADDGKVGVKYIDGAGVVRFLPVTVLEEDSGGIWISGVPEHLNLITLGHTYVSEGQQLDMAQLTVIKNE